MALGMTAVVGLRTIGAVCRRADAECVAVEIIVVYVSSWIGVE
jgi:hypothetical protein